MVDRVFDIEASAECLAHPRSEIEVKVRRVALPGHHVEYRSLAPTETTSVRKRPRKKKLHSESRLPSHSCVCVFPLIFKPTRAAYSLESGDSHDKVIDKLLRNGVEPSVHVVVPQLIDDEVALRRLNVLRVEDYLTEVHVGHHHVLLEGGVPHVAAIVEHLRGDVELDRLTRGCPYPQTRHEEYYFVGSEGLREPSEGSSICLLCVVDILGVVFEGSAVRANVDLSGEVGTMFVPVELMGTLSKVLRWCGNVGSTARYATDSFQRLVIPNI